MRMEQYENEKKIQKRGKNTFYRYKIKWYIGGGGGKITNVLCIEGRREVMRRVKTFKRKSVKEIG